MNNLKEISDAEQWARRELEYARAELADLRSGRLDAAERAAVENQLDRSLHAIQRALNELRRVLPPFEPTA